MRGDHGIKAPIGANLDEDQRIGDASGYVSRFGLSILLDEQQHQIAP